MTDRELLEAAAKAAGLSEYAYCVPWRGMARSNSLGEFFGPTWNPLADDGDALRLAVKLDIDVCRLGDFSRACYCVGCGLFSVAEFDNENADPYAATRRAIVRAAAAIGKEMP